MKTAINSWASKTSKRRIVLQVVWRVGAEHDRWRAEAIDEHGSTVALELAASPGAALAAIEITFTLLARKEKKSPVVTKVALPRQGELPANLERDLRLCMKRSRKTP